MSSSPSSSAAAPAVSPANADVISITHEGKHRILAEDPTRIAVRTEKTAFLAPCEGRIGDMTVFDIKRAARVPGVATLAEWVRLAANAEGAFATKVYRDVSIAAAPLFVPTGRLDITMKSLGAIDALLEKSRSRLVVMPRVIARTMASSTVATARIELNSAAFIADSPVEVTAYLRCETGVIGIDAQLMAYTPPEPEAPTMQRLAEYTTSNGCQFIEDPTHIAVRTKTGTNAFAFDMMEARRVGSFLVIDITHTDCVAGELVRRVCTEDRLYATKVYTTRAGVLFIPSGSIEVEARSDAAIDAAIAVVCPHLEMVGSIGSQRLSNKMHRGQVLVLPVEHATGESCVELAVRLARERDIIAANPLASTNYSGTDVIGALDAPATNAELRGKETHDRDRERDRDRSMTTVTELYRQMVARAIERDRSRPAPTNVTITRGPRDASPLVLREESGLVAVQCGTLRPIMLRDAVEHHSPFATTAGVRVFDVTPLLDEKRGVTLTAIIERLNAGGHYATRVFTRTTDPFHSDMFIADGTLSLEARDRASLDAAIEAAVTLTAARPMERELLERPSHTGLRGTVPVSVLRAGETAFHVAERLARMPGVVRADAGMFDEGAKHG